jgi:Group II intron, maturase-specific domain
VTKAESYECVLRLDHKSRMSCEVHVRFREGLGVRFPRATRLVITAPTREVLETYARPQVEQFLQERGLALSEAKTRIVHIKEGFNFLGFHIRKFGKQGKLLTVPQKEKVLKHVRATRSYLDAHKQTPAGQVIRELNPVIRGWANYYRHCAAKHVFQKVRHAQWQMLWSWAKRRHPNKRSKWVQARYFRSDGLLDILGRKGGVGQTQCNPDHPLHQSHRKKLSL